MLNLTVAGKDTTGQVLTWLFHYLSLNPRVENKLREEVVRVCGGKRVTHEMIEEFLYLPAVINETLRLSPPVPIDDKTAVTLETKLDLKLFKTLF